MFASLYFLLYLVSTAVALPIPSLFDALNIFDNASDETAAVPATLSAEEIQAELERPALFARVSYCSSAVVTSMTCGAQCDALGGGVEVLAAGGDDGLIPMYFVAHDASTESIVVAHQGTSSQSIISILNDVKFGLVPLNSTRFPDQPADTEVHDGFQQTFERTADGLLASVQKGMADKGVKKVLITGHSLGGAIATLDAVMLKSNLPADTEITTTVFGLPRVGNQAWVDFLTEKVGDTLTRVSDGNDPVPNVPPTFLGFAHPAGEIHVATPGDATTLLRCSGVDDESCSAGNSLLDVEVQDHNGPYFNGIGFGGKNCPT